jgi:hypothetical protein
LKIARKSAGSERQFIGQDLSQFMEENDWKRHVESYAADQSRDASYGNSRAAQELIRTLDLFEGAPDPALQSTANISEEEIMSVAQAAEQRILKGLITVKIARGASVREMQIDLWAHMRALDRFLFQNRFRFQVSRPSEQWKYGTGAKSLYLIPTINPRRLPTSGLQSFRHRTLLHHRVLPAKIRDTYVDLQQLPGLLFKHDDQPRYGAAFFSDFELLEEMQFA